MNEHLHDTPHYSFWWKEGVIYQIYPRSFMDSNADGIGDISGIIQKLDYLQDLGVVGIWLSPINKSPMYDFGYDVSDYRGIDPVFGTLKDFERLIDEAHARHIRIIMDLVMNHTSHLHPWFVESRSSRTNPKRDWYIWQGNKKGKYPNNWMAYFGGRAWEWDEKTGQYYLHSFLKEQPDVNWRNPELKKAMFNEVRFWLDKGIDGFRLDVVNFFIKDDQFRSNPFGIGKYPRPYDLQKHIYDRDRPELLELLSEWRALLDKYDARMMVGEVVAEKPNPALAAKYLGDGTNALHLAFDFSFMDTKWDAKLFENRLRAYHERIPEKGWPCTVFSNHDQVRSFTRYSTGDDGEKRARVIAMLLITMRGTPFIYYGEEIGMQNVRIPKSRIQDPVGKRYWPFNPGRDGERTPMQWDSTQFAGFSSVEPWLPIARNFREKNVEIQLREPSSLLNFYKDLIAFRKKSTAIRYGTLSFLNAGHDLLSYLRCAENESCCIILNFTRFPRTCTLNIDGVWNVALSTHRKIGEQFHPTEKLFPYEATIIKKEHQA
ncbi:MAG: alpha-amylase family glycosyl hydrolase [Spirochaetes bacterium]|nr:alpha-amylase family glycosyl hydrolase [Spirochaetota bacterium]